MKPESGCSGPPRQRKGQRIRKRGDDAELETDAQTFSQEGHGDPPSLAANFNPAENAGFFACLRTNLDCCGMIRLRGRTTDQFKYHFLSVFG